MPHTLTSVLFRGIQEIISSTFTTSVACTFSSLVHLTDLNGSNFLGSGCALRAQISKLDLFFDRAVHGKLSIGSGKRNGVFMLI